MLRILGQHAADEICDQGRQPFVADQCPVRAQFELAAQDRRIVQLCQRQPAQRQRQQQYTERIDVVGDAAVTPPGGVAHGAVGGLEQGGLVHRGRRRPGGPQDQGLAALPREHVVEPYCPMGHAAGSQFLQREGDRPQHMGDERGFRPRVQVAGERRSGRCRADDEIPGFAARAWRRAIRQRCHHAIDRHGQILQGAGSRGQVAADLDGDQGGVAALPVLDREGGQAAAGLRHRLSQQDRIAVGDEDFGLVGHSGGAAGSVAAQ